MNSSNNQEKAIQSAKYALCDSTRTLVDQGTQAEHIPYMPAIIHQMKALFLLTGVVPIFILNRANPKDVQGEWCLNGDPLKVSEHSYYSFDSDTFAVTHIEVL